MVVGWGWMQSRLAVFRFGEVDVDRMKGVTNVIDSETEKVKVDGIADMTVRYYGAIHSKSDSMVYLPSERVVFAGDLLFIGIAPVMWAGPAAKWSDALSDLIKRTGDDWLFVPGHGPVTDLTGVQLVKEYFDYVHKAVTERCTPSDEKQDLDCAYKLLEGLPKQLREAFSEPQRILITAQVECMTRRKGGSIQVELPTKVKLLAAQGEYAVRELVGMVKHAS
uniref:Metallo-beta-lactamase domain-containing protein n=3 Tax=Hemiselmis andersenii TaxID=464988 RepID=A0A7S1MWP6_HEMAN|mmetsp:Transcript_61228/g.147364  ORF Transcript_61228/g.147364 Transcript_61228/m.147364 type:complete len:222 (+) Transcript_61228:158-823(+)